MTAVFSQIEFIHGQFPFKSLKLIIDSSNSFGEKMCGENICHLKIIVEISSQAFYFSRIAASDSSV